VIDMKKILMMVVTIFAVLALTVGPSSAASCYCSPWDYFQQVDCGSAPMTGHLAINKGGTTDAPRLYVEVAINDAGSGAPHNWNWYIYHDGDLSASGGDSGDFQYHRLLVNFVGGPDYIKFKAVAGNGATCVQDINVYGQ